jgi:short chain dehydrogenase
MRITRWLRPASPPSASSRGQRHCGSSRRKGGADWRSNWIGERVELSGKVALVRSSSRGIGREIARELARKGARVAVHYRTDREAARRRWPPARAGRTRPSWLT